MCPRRRVADWRADTVGLYLGRGIDLPGYTDDGGADSVRAGVTATILFSGGKAKRSTGGCIRLQCPSWQSINITYLRSQKLYLWVWNDETEVIYGVEIVNREASEMLFLSNYYCIFPSFFFSFSGKSTKSTCLHKVKHSTGNKVASRDLMLALMRAGQCSFLKNIEYAPRVGMRKADGMNLQG